MNANVDVATQIWTVLSNLAYLFPAFYLLNVQLYVEALTMFNITLWSSLYHICFNLDQCVANRDLLQIMDFFSAYTCISFQIIYFMDIYPRKYKNIFHFIV